MLELWICLDIKGGKDGCEGCLYLISSDSTGGKVILAAFIGLLQVLVCCRESYMTHSILSLHQLRVCYSLFSSSKFTMQRIIFRTYANSFSHYYNIKIQKLDVLRDTQEVIVFVTLLLLDRYRKCKLQKTCK